MFLLFVHLQRTFMLLSFRFAPLREWERQKENLIAFMEEARALNLPVPDYYQISSIKTSSISADRTFSQVATSS